MSSKLQSDGCYYYTQQWRPLVNATTGVVCLQVKLCDPDPHLSALEVRYDEALYKSTFTFTFILSSSRLRNWKNSELL